MDAKVEKRLAEKTPRGNDIGGRMQEHIKSPSDTTLYTPVLKKGVENDALISKISNFIEGLRLQDERDNQRGKDQQCKGVISDQQTARKASIDRV